MKIIRTLFFLTALVGFFAHATAAERAAVQCILIKAANEKGETDPRLAPYENTLRRILRFESFKFVGEDSASIAAQEKGQLSLGSGHSVAIENERSDGKALHLRVRWLSGGRNVMHTGLVLRPGVPAVLGGPSAGKNGEVFAIILVSR